MKSIDNKISELPSLVYASQRGIDAKYRRIFLFFLFLAILALFLPWTQNIRAKGTLTTLYPGERPQELNSIIHGQVEQWFVKEGDMVNKGDTILKLTEIKMEYLDPELLNRTEEQIESKQGSNNAYRQKIIAIEQQRLALENGRRYKISQAQNKIRQIENYLSADSMALIAADNDLSIADKQLKRQKEMFNKGIKSLTDLEQRTQQYQNAIARKANIENKILALKNEYIIARTELSSIQMEYDEKISKAQSDEYSTLSNLNQGEGDLAKMKNQFSNYSIRSGFYFVTAPTAGQITRTIKAGIGEIVKEYEHLVTITPSEYHLAVEMFVRPIDVPLLSKGQKVAFQFDGWPAIFFSGWPNIAYGTFLGRVVAIENNISPDGTFRVLVAETSEFQKWPKEIRVGGGAQGYALLKDVPIWYEIWRQINSFPPDYYKPHLNKKDNAKK
jgi:multidrug resistance efflux pump